MTVRVVVVGNGMAGFRFVQELTGAGFAITVIGEEPGGAYNRAQLPNLLTGRAVAESLELADEEWYAVRGVRLLTGVAAGRIDRDRRVVSLVNGHVVRYDVLVLATGARVSVPAGLRPAAGVVPFRTLADCDQIAKRATEARSVVVLGGGVLGLETACGLAAVGVPVRLVQRGRRLMERQLDAEGSRVLARTMRSLGVEVLTGLPADADLVVLCCGTRPRTDLARGAGLAVGNGIVVDDQMRSVSDPAIFAIGDCAEHRGRGYGLVAPAWAQAQVAASVVRGADARYAGSTEVVRLKAVGVELAALGSARAERGAEVIRFTDASRGVYTKLVVSGGQLTGAVLLGDTSAAGTITQLFDRGTRLPADRASLLFGGRAFSSGADSPVICQCGGVTRAAIRAAWEDGARTVGEVSARTRACSGCGTCRDTVEGILSALAASGPVAICGTSVG